MDDLFEAKLQQELRQMFDVDTQQYLQNYITKAQQLRPQSWTADIQEMYRLIHTIKGGAVTVGADAILYVATALEDLLSDIRYLSPAPPLEDNQLAQMLLEAGELLASSISIPAIGEQARLAVASSVERIKTLQQQIQQLYLPEWNEQTLLHQEFAEQGFDLVVLDLEMAVEQYSQGNLPLETLEIARRTITQLQQIGQDLQLDSGWTQLLEQFQEQLLTTQKAAVWRSELPTYLSNLKHCAKAGGKLTAFPAKLQTETSLSHSVLLESTVTELDWQESVDLEELFVPLASEELIELDSDPLLDFAGFFPETSSTLEEMFPALDVDIPLIEETESASIQEQEQKQESLSEVSEVESEENDIQIPVPLSRLDLTAKHLVEVLLTARAAQSFYKNLQSQLVKLLGLANDSAQYITRLRQIQDDYAILENLNSIIDNSSSAPTLERYRQGYTTINRLLEISLRLSELGAEVGKFSQATAESLHGLDRNILNLQGTVEESRLVPFKNLAFRARAILRDLTTRYKKLAVLEVRGEEIELDAGTASKLEPALLHLLRNAFDHALESPTDRLAAGKPEQGKISLFLRRRGNWLAIELKDDGRGIDARTIQKIAEAKKLPFTRTQTAEELLAVICQPGFSSQEKASELSGRGVGMDVVARQVDSLGGKLSLETRLGVGTSFYIQVRVPHLLVPCVILQASHLYFAISTEEVISTSLFGNLKASLTNDRIYSWHIDNGKETLPGLDLVEYWQSGKTARELADTAIAVCVASPDRQESVWLLADDLVAQMPLLINPLPAPLVAPIGLIGVSLQADGSLMPVLEAGAIADYLLATSTNPVLEVTASVKPTQRTEQTSGDENLQQTILVVDDAALMRRRIEASLSAYGYRVHTCADGEEAWNWLQTHPLPTAVITDIEMPGMDGFTLISHCRQAGINIPILVISSRLSEEWSKEARGLGATDYLTKGFSTPELIDKVKSLL